MSREESWRGRRLHFVGIGGRSMSGLALVAHLLGAAVTGSDKQEGAYLPRLREHGVEINVGHAPSNVPDGAEVIYSASVPPVNTERERARELGLRERTRGELLGEVAGLRRCIAVSGTHGKTTTAAMVLHGLRGGGERPSYLIGGTLLATGYNAEWEAGEWLVVEADESDGSLLSLRPEVAIVTNVELEHVRTYRSIAELRAVFKSFLAPAKEAVIWERGDLAGLRDGPAVHFDATDVRLGRGTSCFSWRGMEVRLRVPGEHNARNAAAALEACRLTGADPARAAAALADFPGTARRLQALGVTPSGARVFDDFAHHPTEVIATLAAARTLEPARLIAVLQPHNYTRARALAREFGRALTHADLSVVLEISPGRERPEDYPGVSAVQIARAAAGDGAAGEVAWIPDHEAAERYLRTELRAGDVCVTMGVGDVARIARRLVGQDG